MNTPTHLVLNLALLAAGRRWSHAAPVAAGALAPDLPMFVFYGWQKLVRGASEATIWGTSYFEPGWQLCFDLPHSVPLALGAAALAAALRWPGAALGFVSAALHGLLDLPLHREDAHRHFLPFTDWRFTSPISYWDPSHFGVWAALGETALLVGCGALLWRRSRSRAFRVLLLGLALLQVGAGLAFHWLGFAAEG